MNDSSLYESFIIKVNSKSGKTAVVVFLKKIKKKHLMNTHSTKETNDQPRFSSLNLTDLKCTINGF